MLYKSPGPPKKGVSVLCNQIEGNNLKYLPLVFRCVCSRFVSCVF